MTNKQKRRLLKQMRRAPMTRRQIEPFCTGTEPFELGREIDALCRDGFIQMASAPVNKAGVILSVPEDIFPLTDEGQNYLAAVAKDNFRFWFPVIVSVLALIFSAIALFTPEIYIIAQ